MQIGVSVLNCSQMLRHQSQGTFQDAGESEDSAGDCQVGRGRCLSPVSAMQSLSASLQQTLEDRYGHGASDWAAKFDTYIPDCSWVISAAATMGESLFLPVSVGLYTCQYRGLDVSLQSQKLPFGSIHVMHVSH